MSIPCRVLSHPDGSVIVIHTAPKARRDGEDDATFYARIIARTLEANPTWRKLPGIDVEVSALPPDRRFRNAWRVSGDAVVVDAASARAAALASLRRRRNELLAASDYTDMSGWRRGKSRAVLTAWSSYREALRDLPATTEDPLSVAWPKAPDA